MKKQKAIISAFGEAWRRLPEEAKDHALNNDGWVPKYLKQPSLDKIEQTQLYWRPQSLEGIEDNNGWTELDPGDKLKHGHYWLQHKSGKITLIKTWAAIFKLIDRGYVRYCKPQPPKPPIY